MGNLAEGQASPILSHCGFGSLLNLNWRVIPRVARRLPASLCTNTVNGGGILTDDRGLVVYSDFLFIESHKVVIDRLAIRDYQLLQLNTQGLLSITDYLSISLSA